MTLTARHWRNMRALLVTATVLLSAVITANPVQADGINKLERIANDPIGIHPSLYEGKWFSEKHDPFRRCIMHRESRGNYRAANKISSARGAYQFLDKQWRDGLVWMMLKEERQIDGPLKKELRELFDKPIHKWSRYYQDRAFWTAFRHGKGKHHWHIHGSPCNRLA